MSALDTLPRLLAHNAAQHGPEVALREKQFGIWRAFTWAEYHDRTRLFALGLKRLGVQRGEVIAMIGDNRPDWVMAEIAARSPDQAGMLDRELLGRRFVAPRYFDALYDAGVKNPEHRYSVETFESWRAADSMVRGMATASRGRPLHAGEFTKVMQAAHQMAGSGMVGKLEQSHLKSEDLGRLRSQPKDHVQLGNGFVELDKETAAKLDRNPYLTPMDVKLADRGSRPIIFAPGIDVPRMVAELDAFVLQNEGKMSPAALAAEVHFRLVSIHPFMDGNGRTAKLMADFVLARAGVEAPLWRKSDVMKNVDVWPAAVREGVEFQLDVVKRHFDAVVDVDRPEIRR